jgi:nicotinamidase-related amidase
VAPVTGGTSGIGCTTSLCVESTVRDALCWDDACVVLDDCQESRSAMGCPEAIMTLPCW